MSSLSEMFSPVNLYVVVVYVCICGVFGCFYFMNKKNERKVNRAQSFFISFNSQHATLTSAEQVSVYFQYAMLPPKA